MRTLKNLLQLTLFTTLFLTFLGKRKCHNEVSCVERRGERQHIKQIQHIQQRVTHTSVTRRCNANAILWTILAKVVDRSSTTRAVYVWPSLELKRSLAIISSHRHYNLGYRLAILKNRNARDCVCSLCTRGTID